MEEAGDEVEGEGDREADDATADGKLEEKDVEEEREEVGDDTIVASATTPPRHASPVGIIQLAHAHFYRAPPGPP